MPYASYPSLKDRIVVISGGSTGIGASIVQEFTHQDSQVIILDLDENGATAVCDTLQHAKHRPIFHKCDVTDIEGSLRPTALKILESFPEIHVLINNVGADARIPSAQVTPDQWNQSLTLNLNHQFFLTQFLLPGLKVHGASVINMGSIIWAIPGTNVASYVACKSAIYGLTRTLAHEYGPHGIRVNSIMPGAIETERQRKDVLTPEYIANVISHQAIKRLIQPAEVARMALWLASDDSSAVTNQSMVIDGGWI